jgi:polyhydroxyalkanoate synthesis regulator phasin
MFDLIKKTMLAGVGLAAMTREKIEETIDELVKKGKLSEKEGKEIVEELIEKSKTAKKDLEEKIEKIVTISLKRLNIPTRDELTEIKKRIERLEGSKDEQASTEG